MPTSGYVLGSSDPERHRLVRQAKGIATEASWLLDRVGVERGWRAVDVGCGPIGILDLLCDRVGVTGETVGVDNDARMIAMAREVAANSTSRTSHWSKQRQRTLGSNQHRSTWPTPGSCSSTCPTRSGW